MRDRHIQDTRIHCCLYFINPSGHSLRAIDIIVMKKLSEVVNVVPVIAKADSLTLEERESFKEKVRTRAVSSVKRLAIWLSNYFFRFADPSRDELQQHSLVSFRHRGERRGGDSTQREHQSTCLVLL